MRFWDMPVEISNAIRYQHDPFYAGEDHVYANLVYLAQALLQEQNIGEGGVAHAGDAVSARLRPGGCQAAGNADRPTLTAWPGLRTG